MNQSILAPSILSADFTNLGAAVKETEAAGAQWLHIDMMDGTFVPNLSFGMPVIASLRPVSSLCFDVHMMVQNPDHLLPAVASAGADLITVHGEACTHLHRTIGAIHELGCKAGVALNPATPLSVLDYVLQDLDLVLIMTVNPGFGGQSLIPVCYEKIRTLAEIMKAKNCSARIQVDGGVTRETIGLLQEAGADTFVAGSAVYKGNITDNITGLLEKIK